jgi:hypothetical protein
MPDGETFLLLQNPTGRSLHWASHFQDKGKCRFKVTNCLFRYLLSSQHCICYLAQVTRLHDSCFLEDFMALAHIHSTKIPALNT